MGGYKSNILITCILLDKKIEVVKELNNKMTFSNGGDDACTINKIYLYNDVKDHPDKPSASGDFNIADFQILALY